MHHDGKVKAIGRSQIPDEAHLTIFEDAAEGMSLRAWYGATYGMDFHAPKELWPYFEIEFDEPRSIQNYIVHVSDYVDFLSFCFGVKFKPSAISNDRLSLAEMRAALENRRYPGDHEVHYVWPEADINKRDLWVGGSPVRSWDDQELGALRKCLIAWMNRATTWRKSYALMMMSFGLKNVVSSERLINACRWLEEISDAKPQYVLSDEAY
jgi:ApeA N-terminal domain 1